MKTEIKCPHCGKLIPITESVTNEIKQEIELKFSKERNQLNKLREDFEKEKEAINNLINARVNSMVKQKEDVIRKRLESEKALQLEELNEQLDKKSSELKELNKTKTQLETLKRDFKEVETKILVEKERELNEKLNSARVEIKVQAQKEAYLKLKEKEKIIEDMKLKLDDAKRKAEQGSMQLQGEVQELGILEMLSSFHPTDKITQSKKGANAADILHVIKMQNGTECGKIYYESKRTKTWSNDWIPKLKQDNLKTKADILVLVTHAFPKGIEKYGIVDGVWVCGFNDVKELSLVLRYGLLKVQSVLVTQKGKDSKMASLYKYLTSEEFKNVFESILSGFKTIQESHQSEKTKMQKMWKEREHMMEQILSSSMEFYGSVKGIAGSELKAIDFDVTQYK